MEEAFPSAGDRSVVIRRKRMKRQRPPSPLWSSGGGAGAASSSSSGGDFSPPSSSSGSTEEEEDMAHCLILLAQGPRRQRQRQLSPEGSEARAEINLNGFRSKKFSEVVTASTDATSGANSSTVAKAGFYVYECKTCSRVFPSFQALGGHRASHKKPKHTAGAAEDVKKSPASPGSSREDYDDEGRFGKTMALTPPTNPVQISSIAVSKPKIHECSICGTEFTSGQALGGHMRRHRAMAAPPGAQVTVLGLESSIVTENGFHIDEKSRDVLSLDLNLPAPPEDEHQHLHHHRREAKLQLVTPSSQAPPLMFSSPALVGCHY